MTTDHIQQHMKTMHRLDQSPQPSSDSGSSEVARATGIMERDCRPGQKSGLGTSVVVSLTPLQDHHHYHHQPAIFLHPVR